MNFRSAGYRAQIIKRFCTILFAKYVFNEEGVATLRVLELLPGFWSAPRILECSQDFGVAPRVLE